jgi:hypothetical protein
LTHFFCKTVNKKHYYFLIVKSRKKKLKITLQSFIIPVTIIHILNKSLIMTPEAERFNGWAAMLGFVAAVGAYVTTGQIIPGWF